MGSYTVEVIFADGVNTYTFPLVQNINDPTPGTKSVVIEGNRASGSVVIPGGLKSSELIIKGFLHAADYVAQTTLMDDMRTKVTTAIATITIRHWNGATWVNDRVWNVRRVGEIDFGESFRIGDIEYTCNFLVISF
jgi:hypothetical protein